MADDIDITGAPRGDEVTAERILSLIALLRSKGASVRALAATFGMSKSKMGRWVQAIDASHLGRQPGENPPDIPATADVDLSQMGQQHRKSGAPDRKATGDAVT